MLFAHTGKSQKVFLDSCLKLGGTLLEVWNPNGDKRPSSQSERDFKDDLEDFFNTASCTRFDKDIQDYYEGKSDKYRENFESRYAPSLSVEDEFVVLRRPGTFGP